MRTPMCYGGPHLVTIRSAADAAGRAGLVAPLERDAPAAGEADTHGHRVDALVHAAQVDHRVRQAPRLDHVARLAGDGDRPAADAAGTEPQAQREPALAGAGARGQREGGRRGLARGRGVFVRLVALVVALAGLVVAGRRLVVLRRLDAVVVV